MDAEGFLPKRPEFSAGSISEIVKWAEENRCIVKVLSKTIQFKPNYSRAWWRVEIPKEEINTNEDALKIKIYLEKFLNLDKIKDGSLRIFTHDEPDFVWRQLTERKDSLKRIYRRAEELPHPDLPANHERNLTKQQVKLRLPPKLLPLLDAAVTEGLDNSRNEFIIEAIKDRLTKLGLTLEKK